MYLFGDLNAKHYALGDNRSNSVGNNIATLIDRNTVQHLGPSFPTYMRENCTTAPDIVLSNNKAFYNIHLTPGPLTSADHTPILAKISANPIQIPIKPRFQFPKANWDKFQEELENVPVPTGSHPSTTEIDDHLNKFTELVKKATEESVPTITYRTLLATSSRRSLPR